MAYGYSIKKTQHSIIWRWGVLSKKQDGGWIEICEIFSGKSLKEDLSIDTTFDLCYFSRDSTFKSLLDYGYTENPWTIPTILVLLMLWKLYDELSKRLKKWASPLKADHKKGIPNWPKTAAYLQSNPPKSSQLGTPKTPLQFPSFMLPFMVYKSLGWEISSNIWKLP